MSLTGPIEKLSTEQQGRVRGRVDVVGKPIGQRASASAIVTVRRCCASTLHLEQASEQHNEETTNESSIDPSTEPTHRASERTSQRVYDALVIVRRVSVRLLASTDQRASARHARKPAFTAFLDHSARVRRRASAPSERACRPTSARRACVHARGTSECAIASTRRVGVRTLSGAVREKSSLKPSKRRHAISAHSTVR